MRKKIYSVSGFTLIELLVAMGIVALLGTSSVAIIGNFNRKQAMNVAYDNVKNALAQAKSYALSQVVYDCKVNDPIGSREELVGYKVKFDTSTPNTYTVSEACNTPSGAPKSDNDINTYPLPAGVSFGSVPASGITFKVLTGGAASGSTITLTTDGGSRSITVTSDGVIR